MAVLALLFVVSAMAGAPRFVSFTGGGLLLNDGRVTIDLDPADLKGVSIAARNLATDIGKVCGAEATVGRHADAKIVVGTIGHSAGIDRLASLGVINAKDLKGKCEKYIITTTGNQVAMIVTDVLGQVEQHTLLKKMETLNDSACLALERRILARHREILSAIHRQDDAAAKQAMREHTRAAATDLKV